MAAALSSITHRLAAITVAGTHSGAGKTTITLGLIGALRRRSLLVQPFKVGPDFIDPLHHTRAAGRPSINLDGWMLSPDVNRRRFAAAAAGARVAVVEGVMGLFDGSDPRSDRGSTAEMAKLIGSPVVLVVDAGAMARSAAAVVHGFTTFDPGLAFAGVVFNRVGSDRHAEMLRAAMEGGLPVLGCIPSDPAMQIGERHLGLHLPRETAPDVLGRAADLVEAHVDLDAILRAGEIAVEAAAAAPHSAGRERTRARIGLARDEAFCFYYADNLDLLREAGAELVEFSPMRDPLPAGLDGLYVGGGYPELHAGELAANRAALEGVRELARRGRPVYGECGGMMYLGEKLTVDGSPHAMCGVLPLSTRIPAGLALAYAEVTTTGGLFGGGHVARGHLFHHSALEAEPPGDRVYEIETPRGDRHRDGFQSGSVLGSYVHLHFASDPGLARAFVDRCAASL